MERLGTKEVMVGRSYVAALKKVGKLNKEVHAGIANIILEKTKMLVPYGRAKIWADELKIKEELNARIG